MAKLVFSLMLVNGTGPPDREVGAHELLRAFVSDDTRPPPQSVGLTAYTDDGHKVCISIPADGIGDVYVSVKPWGGEEPRATSRARLQTRMSRPRIIALIGEPEIIGSADEPFGGTDEWRCGCYARPHLFYDHDEPREDAVFEWVQCDEHEGDGGGPFSEAPESFGYRNRRDST
jgi:hypothetical protein